MEASDQMNSNFQNDNINDVVNVGTGNILIRESSSN